MRELSGLREIERDVQRVGAERFEAKRHAARRLGAGGRARAPRGIWKSTSSFCVELVGLVTTTWAP